MKAAVDNDVLFKGCCYGLLGRLIGAVCDGVEAVGVLGSARFVVAKKIEKAELRGNPSGALVVLSEFLSRSQVLEPSPSEQAMAADLELNAQRLGLNLDSGESQLCAILVFRVLPLLLTGDKRAITAIEGLVDTDERLLSICRKVTCLEQLVRKALHREGHVVFRGAICAEPEVDKALAICFSCSAPSMAASSIDEGLDSYIRSLRMHAPRVLSL
jgi:hypothetical protein